MRQVQRRYSVASKSVPAKGAWRQATNAFLLMSNSLTFSALLMFFDCCGLPVLPFSVS